MMNFYVNAVYGLSIGAAVGAAWLRWRTLPSTYGPFLTFVWVAFFTELLSINIALNGDSNIPLINGFILVQVLLLNAQFRRLQLIRTRRVYWIWQGCFAAWWLLEMALRQSPYQVASIFLMGSSFAIVLMSLTTITHLLFSGNGRLVRHPAFIICFAFTVYYTYAVLVETCFAFRISEAVLTRLHIYQILCYINLFTNLSFVLAILWMPHKNQSLP